MTADDILTRAADLFASALGNYRDQLLQVGRLLHEFVLAWVGDGGTRDAAIEAAAGRLKRGKPNVRQLIAAAMAADILGAGEVGGLSWKGVLAFARMLRRKRQSGRHAKGREDEIARETWEADPERAGDARTLFRRAADGGFTEKDVVGAEKRMGAKRFVTERHVEPPARSAAVASPRDLAEQLWESVRESPDPGAVMRHLLTLSRELVPA